MIELDLALKVSLHVLFEVADSVSIEVFDLCQNGRGDDIRSLLHHLELSITNASCPLNHLCSCSLEQ